MDVCLPELVALMDKYQDSPAEHLRERTAADVCKDQLFNITQQQTTALRAGRRQRVLDQIADPLARAWFRSGGGDGARVLLNGGPEAPFSQQLAPTSFVALLRTRLGLPPSDTTPVSGECPHCTGVGKGIEPSGLHALRCNEKGKGGLSGYRARRHAVVLHAIRSAFDYIAGLKAASGAVVLADKYIKGVVGDGEPLASRFWQRQPGLAATATTDSRGDLVFYDRALENPTILDLTVVFANPAGSRYPKAADVDGSAAAKAAEDKVKQYKRDFVVPDGGFVPFAIELGGRMLPAARAALSKFVAGLLPKGGPDAWTGEEKLFYASSVSYLVVSIQIAVAKVATSTLRRIPQGVPAHMHVPATVDDTYDSEDDVASGPGDEAGGGGG